MDNEKLLGIEAMRALAAEARVDDFILISLEEDLSTVGGIIQTVEELKITFSFMGISLSITAQDSDIVCSSPMPNDTELYPIARVDIDSAEIDKSDLIQKTYDDSKLYL